MTEGTSAAAVLLSKHELLLPAEASERVAALSERVATLLTVGVVAVVEAFPQLRIDEDLVGFVDRAHLRLDLFGSHRAPVLVGVVLFGKLAVRFLNLTFGCVPRYAEDFVVVFGL